MMHSNNALISNLHHAYRNLTGFDIGLDMDRERRWYDWQKRGNTEADLAMVINYLKIQIKIRLRFPGSLKFNNLIGMPDKFEEDLSLARAWLRNLVPPATPRQRVLVCAGREPNHTQVPVTVKTTADVMAGARAFEEFRKWRMESGL